MIAYLDNSATTQVCPEAAESVMKMMTECFGNPSSTHHIGRMAKVCLDEARKNVAAAIDALPEEVFFTSGGTESDNWALYGAAELMRHKGKHIITTAVEHDAVLKSAERLERMGYEVSYIAADKAGRIDMEKFKNALREDTTLVSAMLVNNETGAVNDIAAISRELKIRKSIALLHTDAVQGFCKIPFTAKGLGVDFMTLSSHKIHGPKGIGALYVKRGVRLPAMIMGGGQERNYRSGTEALPAIAGFGTAAKIGNQLLTKTEEELRKMREYTVARVKELIPDVVIIGAGDAPHILSISLPGYKSEVLMNWLDSEGVYVSKSSACKRGGRSHVLEAMDVPNKVIDGAIRVSFSRMNTINDAEYFSVKLKEAADRLIKVK